MSIADTQSQISAVTPTPENVACVFPVELTDLIIDHLNDDKESLQACSLVCSSWLPRTRHHLFSCFKFRNVPLSPFDLFRSPYCTIRPFVHALTIAFSDTFAPNDVVPIIQHFASHVQLTSLTVMTRGGCGITPLV
ncbi:hypothetical protein BD779DRAFT_797413 [Infundibulicybe gibba]|nr:hypothetical protein BD779DRAFT_797413 [Infundibulicybe gibba]